MICPGCGKEIPNGLKFCKYCGSPLESVSPGSQTNDMGTGDIETELANDNMGDHEIAPKTISKSEKMVIGILSVILVALTGVVVFIFTRPAGFWGDQYDKQIKNDSEMVLGDGSVDRNTNAEDVDREDEAVTLADVKNESDDLLSLYRPVLDMFYHCISNRWNDLDWSGYDDPLDPDSVSYLWYQFYNEIGYDEAGFALMDLDDNGIDELIVLPTEMMTEDQGMIFDLYTIVNDSICHLASSGERARYYIAEGNVVCLEGSSSYKESSWEIYHVEGDKTELQEDMALIYNGSEDEDKNSWYFSTDVKYIEHEEEDHTWKELDMDSLTGISDDEYQEIMSKYPKHISFELTSLDKYENGKIICDEYSANTENGTTETHEKDVPKNIVGTWKSVYHGSLGDELNIVFENAQQVRYITPREDYKGTYEYDTENKKLTMRFFDGKVYDNSIGEWKDGPISEIDLDASVTGETMLCRYADNDKTEVELLKIDLDESLPVMVDTITPNRRLNMFLSLFEEYGLRSFDPYNIDLANLYLFCFNYHSYAYHPEETVSSTEKGVGIREECMNEICREFFGIEAPKESYQSGDYYSVTYEGGMYYFMVGDAGDIEVPVSLVNGIEKIGENEYQVTFDTVYVAVEDYGTGEPNYYLYSESSYVVPENENIYYSREYKDIQNDRFVTSFGSGKAVVKQTDDGLILLKYDFEPIYD